MTLTKQEKEAGYIQPAQPSPHTVAILRRVARGYLLVTQNDEKKTCYRYDDGTQVLDFKGLPISTRAIHAMAREGWLIPIKGESLFPNGSPQRYRARTTLDQEMIGIVPTAAEKAIAERDRVARRYRAARKAEIRQLFNTEPHGRQLWKLHATLGHFGIEDAARMKEYVQREVDAWLGAALFDIRYEALRLIGARITRIRQRAGLVPFDDPLPGEPDRIFQTVKKMLRV